MSVRHRILFGISVIILLALCTCVCNVYAQGAQECYRKAQELLNQMQYDQSFAEINKAIQIDPSVAEYYAFRGKLYRDYKGDVGSALSDFNKSIELNPNNGEVYYFRAICYYFTKEYDKAWKDAAEARRLGYAVPSYFINDLQTASGQTRSIF